MILMLMHMVGHWLWSSSLAYFVYYSTVGCRRTWGRRSQPRSFLFFTTPANLVLIFQSVFESRWLACSAHTVGDDACRAQNAAEMFQTIEVESFRSQQCRRRSRLHSKRCLGVVRLFLQPGDVLIFRWNSSLAVLRQTVLRHPTVLYEIPMTSSCYYCRCIQNTSFTTTHL